MDKNDKIFGTIEFEYIWFRELNIEFIGENEKISLLISGDEDGEFEDEQYEAYTALMKVWNVTCQSILEPILSYYQEKRHELGYDIDFNADYPDIKTVIELRSYITITGITIPYAIYPESRYIGVIFDCTWDSENGVGVKLIDEKVDGVGYQDLVM